MDRRRARAALLEAPVLGAGLGFRPEIAREIMGHCGEIDVVEVLADRVLRGARRDWEEVRDLARIFPIVPHGVNLSVGSADCLRDSSYLSALKRLARWVAYPYYSDHLALTKVRGRDIGHLSPLWLTREQLGVVVSNVRAVQRRLERPLVLETITVPFDIPGGELAPADFINEVTHRTGCGLLLDLENVYINGENLGLSPRAFLDRLDLEAVIQIHLAGGIRRSGSWIDSHSAPVQEAVWRLYARTAPRCPNLKAVIIERDSRFTGFKGLLSELRRARRLWQNSAAGSRTIGGVRLGSKTRAETEPGSYARVA